MLLTDHVLSPLYSIRFPLYLGFSICTCPQAEIDSMLQYGSAWTAGLPSYVNRRFIIEYNKSG